MCCFETESLILRAKRGDSEALERLLLAHYDVVQKHISRRMPSFLLATYSADDVTQETYLEAFSQIARLRGESTEVFVAWLKALGDMSLAKCLRLQNRRKRGAGHANVNHSGNDELARLLDHLPSDTKTASSLIARREAIAGLRVAMAALPDDQRLAIQLHLLQGMTIEHTADAMNRSVGAVRGLLQRGKKRIADSMGRASSWLPGR